MIVGSNQSLKLMRNFLQARRMRSDHYFITFRLDLIEKDLEIFTFLLFFCLEKSAESRRRFMPVDEFLKNRLRNVGYQSQIVCKQRFCVFQHNKNCRAVFVWGGRFFLGHPVQYCTVQYSTGGESESDGATGPMAVKMCLGM